MPMLVSSRTCLASMLAAALCLGRGEGFALSALPYCESLSVCPRLSLRPRCRCASVGAIQRSLRHLRHPQTRMTRMTAAESLEVMSLPAEPSPELSVGWRRREVDGGPMGCVHAHATHRKEPEEAVFDTRSFPLRRPRT